MFILPFICSFFFPEGSLLYEIFFLFNFMTVQVFRRLANGCWASDLFWLIDAKPLIALFLANISCNFEFST